MTSRVQEALSLPTSALKVVEIQTFGSLEGVRLPYNMVKLNILTRESGGLPISALVVSHICDVVE